MKLEQTEIFKIYLLVKLCTGIILINNYNVVTELYNTKLACSE